MICGVLCWHIFGFTSDCVNANVIVKTHVLHHWCSTMATHGIIYWTFIRWITFNILQAKFIAIMILINVSWKFLIFHYSIRSKCFFSSNAMHTNRFRLYLSSNEMKSVANYGCCVTATTTTLTARIWCTQSNVQYMCVYDLSSISGCSLLSLHL